MTATACTTAVHGKGFHIVIPAFSHDERVSYPVSLDEAGDESAVAVFKTKSAASKRAVWENDWNARVETGVRYEVREVKDEGHVYFLLVAIYTWPEPEQAPAEVPCVDCGEVVDIEETINAGHGHAVCPKTTSRHMTGHRVPRDAVEALEKRQRWEAHQAATLRPATEEETEAWLSGHLAVEGAVETEHGLLVPQSLAEKTSCKHCEAEIEYYPGTGWVDVLSGDKGGTYDNCPRDIDADHEPVKGA